MISLYSGLIAALVSGCVSLIGYYVTAKMQRKNGQEAVKTQMEIAKMQRDEKLFYQNQLELMGEVRKLIAKFVSDCFKLNQVAKEIGDDNFKRNLNSLDDARRLIAKYDAVMNEATELVYKLHEEVTMIRLNLFHKDDPQERKVLEQIMLIEQSMSRENGIRSGLLDSFVNVVRDYFDFKMAELKNQSV